jgi:hypothetical protein
MIIEEDKFFEHNIKFLKKLKCGTIHALAIACCLLKQSCCSSQTPIGQQEEKL